MSFNGIEQSPQYPAHGAADSSMSLFGPEADLTQDVPQYLLELGAIATGVFLLADVPDIRTPVRAESEYVEEPEALYSIPPLEELMAPDESTEHYDTTDGMAFTEADIVFLRQAGVRAELAEEATGPAAE